MPVHMHPPPACGTGQHNPHAPSCSGFTAKMTLCTEVTEPNHPDAGKCLCKHEAVEAMVAPVSMTPTPAFGEPPAPPLPAAAPGPAPVPREPVVHKIRAASKKAKKKAKAKRKPAKKAAKKKKNKRRR